MYRRLFIHHWQSGSYILTFPVILCRFHSFSVLEMDGWTDGPVDQPTDRQTDRQTDRHIVLRGHRHRRHPPIGPDLHVAGPKDDPRFGAP